MRREIGSIRQLGPKHWEVCVTAGRNPKTGAQVRKYKNVRGSKKDAEKALMALAVNVGNGDAVREKLTLDSYWSGIFLPNARDRVRPRTVDGYEYNYNSLVRDSLGGLPLAQITPPVIERWLSGFSTNRRKFDALRFLGMVLRRAVKDRVLERDPTVHVEAPKFKKYQPVILDAATAALYLKSAQGHEIEPMILVVLGGGLRREEFVPLRWSDISSEGDVVIDEAITSYAGKIYEGDTKSQFSERVVRFPSLVTARLNEIRGPDNAYLIASKDGSHVNPDRLSRMYRTWQKECLPPDTVLAPLKDLRHTSLTLTLEAGADLLTVSRRAGHSTTAITAAYYLRPHRSVDEAAASGLDDLLGSV